MFHTKVQKFPTLFKPREIHNLYLRFNFGMILCPVCGVYVHECTSETVCECVLI